MAEVPIPLVPLKLLPCSYHQPVCSAVYQVLSDETTAYQFAQDREVQCLVLANTGRSHGLG